MCNWIKKLNFFPLIFFLSLIFHFGCVEKTHHSFENKIKAMSDTELINCYNAIEDNIRTVDSKMQGDDRTVGNIKRQDRDFNLIPTPFYIGGEGYELVEKRKKVIKEMEKRNITPK